jgi:hypothetical protein
MEKSKVTCREQCRPVLEAEIARWTTKSHEELISKLAEAQNYEVARDGKNYQVEVSLVENTERYLHVLVAVDDGSVPASFRPLSASFIIKKISKKVF